VVLIPGGRSKRTLLIASTVVLVLMWGALHEHTSQSCLAEVSAPSSAVALRDLVVASAQDLLIEPAQSAPAVSPNGRKAVFWRRTPSSKAVLCVYDLDDEVEAEVAEAKRPGHPLPLWFPDSRHVLIGEAADGERPRFIVADTQLRFASTIETADEADGDNLPSALFWAFGGSIWACPAPYTSAFVLGRNPALPAESEPAGDRSRKPAFDALVAVSPDGTMLLIHFGRNVFVSGLDLADAKRLCEGDTRASAWMPAGLRVAVVEGSALVAYDIATGTREVLIDRDVAGPIVWSPDGARVVVGRRIYDLARPFSMNIESLGRVVAWPADRTLLLHKRRGLRSQIAASSAWAVPSAYQLLRVALEDGRNPYLSSPEVARRMYDEALASVANTIRRKWLDKVAGKGEKYWNIDVALANGVVQLIVEDRFSEEEIFAGQLQPEAAIDGGLRPPIHMGDLDFEFGMRMEKTDESMLDNPASGLPPLRGSRIGLARVFGYPVRILNATQLCARTPSGATVRIAYAKDSEPLAKDLIERKITAFLRPYLAAKFLWDAQELLGITFQESLQTVQQLARERLDRRQEATRAAVERIWNAQPQRVKEWGCPRGDATNRATFDESFGTALDVLWKRKGNDRGWGVLLSGDRAYLLSEKAEVVDASTGEVLQERDWPIEPHGPCVLHRGVLYVPTSSGHRLAAYDARTLEFLWGRAYDAESLWPDFSEGKTLQEVRSDGSLDVYTRYLRCAAGDALYVAYPDHLAAIDCATGNLLWHRKGDVTNHSDFHEFPYVAAIEDRVFVVQYLRVRAFDSRTGDELWKYEMPELGERRFILLAGVIVQGDEVMTLCSYVPDDATKQGLFMLSFDAATGKRLRKVPMPWHTNWAAWAVDGKVAYVFGVRTNAAVDLETGERLWTMSYGAGLVLHPKQVLVCGDQVILAGAMEKAKENKSLPNTVWLIDAQAGTEIASYAFQDVRPDSFTAVPGTVVATLWGGKGIVALGVRRPSRGAEVAPPSVEGPQQPRAAVEVGKPRAEAPGPTLAPAPAAAGPFRMPRGLQERLSRSLADELSDAAPLLPFEKRSLGLQCRSHERAVGNVEGGPKDDIVTVSGRLVVAYVDYAYWKPLARIDEEYWCEGLWLLNSPDQSPRIVILARDDDRHHWLLEVYREGDGWKTRLLKELLVGKASRDQSFCVKGPNGAAEELVLVLRPRSELGSNTSRPLFVYSPVDSSVRSFDNIANGYRLQDVFATPSGSIALAVNRKEKQLAAFSLTTGETLWMHTYKERAPVAAFGSLKEGEAPSCVLAGKGTVQVLDAQGTVTFQMGIEEQSPRDVVLCDLDLDGRSDVVILGNNLTAVTTESRVLFRKKDIGRGYELAVGRFAPVDTLALLCRARANVGKAIPPSDLYLFSCEGKPRAYARLWRDVRSDDVITTGDFVGDEKLDVLALARVRSGKDLFRDPKDAYVLSSTDLSERVSPEVVSSALAAAMQLIAERSPPVGGDDRSKDHLVPALANALFAEAHSHTPAQLRTALEVQAAILSEMWRRKESKEVLLRAEQAASPAGAPLNDYGFSLVRAYARAGQFHPAFDLLDRFVSEDATHPGLVSLMTELSENRRETAPILTEQDLTERFVRVWDKVLVANPQDVKAHEAVFAWGFALLERASLPEGVRFIEEVVVPKVSDGALKRRILYRIAQKYTFSGFDRDREYARKLAQQFPPDTFEAVGVHMLACDYLWVAQRVLDPDYPEKYPADVRDKAIGMVERAQEKYVAVYLMNDETKLKEFAERFAGKTLGNLAEARLNELERARQSPPEPET